MGTLQSLVAAGCEASSRGIAEQPLRALHASEQLLQVLHKAVVVAMATTKPTAVVPVTVPTCYDGLCADAAFSSMVTCDRQSQQTCDNELISDATQKAHKCRTCSKRRSCGSDIKPAQSGCCPLPDVQVEAAHLARLCSNSTGSCDNCRKGLVGVIVTISP